MKIQCMLAACAALVSCGASAAAGFPTVSTFDDIHYRDGARARQADGSWQTPIGVSAEGGVFFKFSLDVE